MKRLILVALLLVLSWSSAPALLAQSEPDPEQGGSNPLPPLPSGRQLHFGYYYTDGQYGDYNAETRCFTNLYIPAVPVENLGQAIAQAAQAGQASYIHLLLGPNDDDRETIEATIAPVLESVAPQWDSVAYVEIWHEPNVYLPNHQGYFDPAQIAPRAQIVREILSDWGLAPRPLGVMLAQGDIFHFSPPPNMWTTSTLDFIGFEAYLYGADGGDPVCDILATLRNRVAYAANRLAPMNLVLAVQSYNLNDTFLNIPALVAMQAEYYKIAVGEPRILSLNAFAYARGGGVLSYPVLRPIQKQIGERVRHGLPAGCSEPADPLPACGGGPGGTGPYDMRLNIVNLLAGLTWVNGSGNPNQLRLWRRSGTDPEWHHVTFLDPSRNSAEVPLGQPGPSGNTVCFKVQALFGNGNPLESNEACGTFYASAPSVAPHQNTPTGCASSLHPPLKWDPVPRATKHWIYLVHTPDDMPLINDSAADEGSVYLPGMNFLPGHRYRWKVAAGNNFGWGPWSSPVGVYFTPKCTARSDWNGDGSTDLLLRNPATGDLSLLYLSGATQSGTATLDPSRPVAGNWLAVGTNDFNGDRKPDVVWQNTDSGNLAFWLYDGVTRTAGVPLTGPGPSWKVVGTGDFNADGHPDLLFRQPGTQNLKAWFLAGTSQVGESVITSAWNGYDTWELAAVGDLNGDTSPDLIWRQPVTGNLVIWNMRGTTNTAVGALSPASLPDFNWRLVSIFDVDQDGASDLVWQNEVSGKLVVWSMEGTVRKAGTFFVPDAPPDPALRAIGPR